MVERFQAGTYDAIVVGAGHAGCEAALALARLGHKTLVLTVNLDSVAFLACNPSIGGTAKGHIVREVDALGGQMGLAADATLLQLRMLNLAKGPAVHSLRAQADKNAYHTYMKRTLESTENLELRQGEAVRVLTANGQIAGVLCANGAEFRAKTVVLATGVYLKSQVVMGGYRVESGPSGFFPANGLTQSLIELGFNVRRFKTGTPARVDRRSVDFTKMERQNSDACAYPFSFMTDALNYTEHPCYLTYTNEHTHEIIRKNLSRSPLFSGDIKGTGPRYCPSIEDKVVRFADRERHQVFLEPEGADTNEMYVQGMSSSMPPDVQTEMYHSVAGLENAVLMRYAYAIEYDCIDPCQLLPTLQYKELPGLFTAGQINGSSGYEEAAGQGLVAGINAALYLENRPPLVLGRHEAYIGVLIDDLVTKGTSEPYRMMTARAEYRLHLRQDNADARLTERGRGVGLVSDARYARYCKKREAVECLTAELDGTLTPAEAAPLLSGQEAGARISKRELLKRGGVSLAELAKAAPFSEEYPDEVLQYVETEVKYEGYLKKQEQEIARAKKLEEKRLPEKMDYLSLNGLRIEARQKLDKVRPLNLGQASRISGVSPADVAVLILYLAERREGA